MIDEDEDQRDPAEEIEPQITRPCRFGQAAENSG
jgi:hypothetical protein